MSSIAKRTIDDETARRAVEAAAAKAREIKVNLCIAVCDGAAQLKAYLRMDGAPMISASIAQDKAHTSASFSCPTHALFEWMKEDPPLLHGIMHYPRLIVFGGGFPIVEAGETIGAIGISGGHYSQDMECARAALEAIGAPIP